MTRQWWACAEPERPPDPYVIWHFLPCHGCLIKIRAQAMRFPKDETVQRFRVFIEAGWPESDVA